MEALASKKNAGVNQVGHHNANHDASEYARRQRRGSRALQGVGGAFACLRTTGAFTWLRGTLGAEESGRADAAAGLRVV